MPHPTSPNSARVTIAVPTYNGGPYLRDCLNNILEQTFQDYDVLISDNGSTDQSSEIAREFAARDSRFRYFKQPRHLEAAPHFSSLPALATSPMFIWHSDDDVWGKNYLEVLVGLLDANPHAQLAVGDYVTEYMDAPRRRVVQAFQEFGPGTADRMRELSQFPAGWIYGLFRTAGLQKIAEVIHDRFPLTRGWDLLVVFHYCLNNQVVGSRETNFTWRCYSDQSLSRDLAAGIEAHMWSRHASRAHLKTIGGKLAYEIKHARAKAIKKIAKVDYMIGARRLFFAIASEWIAEKSLPPVEALWWRLYLWQFMARRIYPARKAVKYKILRMLFGTSMPDTYSAHLPKS